MLSVIKSKRFLTGLLLGVFSFCISLLYNVIPILFLDAESAEIVWSSLSENLFSILASSGFLICFVTFVCYYIGDLLKDKLKLNTGKIDKRGIIIVVLLSIVVPFIIGFLDLYLMMGEEFVSIYYTLVNVSTSIFYNGVFEEIWFRYGFISLMIYTFHKVFTRNDSSKSDGEIDKKYYAAGLIFTVLFLFGFQFNTITTMYYISVPLFIRTFLVYFIPNLSYGYLFLKYNIKVSIIAHVLFIIMHLGIVPFIASFI